MNKRDLKADLASLTGDWGVHENNRFRANGVEIAEHAIERAFELEEANKTLGDMALNMFDEIEVLEALARELVDMLGRVTPRYLVGRLELDLDLVHEANGLLKKAKEVLGGEKSNDCRLI